MPRLSEYGEGVTHWGQSSARGPAYRNGKACVSAHGQGYRNSTFAHLSRAGERGNWAERVLFECAIEPLEFYTEFVTAGACLNSETPQHNRQHNRGMGITDHVYTHRAIVFGCTVGFGAGFVRR